jgi:hypothetical protein
MPAAKQARSREQCIMAYQGRTRTRGTMLDHDNWCLAISGGWIRQRRLGALPKQRRASSVSFVLFVMWPQLAATRSDPASKQRRVCACGGVRLSIDVRRRSQDSFCCRVIGSVDAFSHRARPAGKRERSAPVFILRTSRRARAPALCLPRRAFPVLQGVQQRALRARPLQAATAEEF